VLSRRPGPGDGPVTVMAPAVWPGPAAPARPAGPGRTAGHRHSDWRDRDSPVGLVSRDRDSEGPGLPPGAGSGRPGRVDLLRHVQPRPRDGPDGSPGPRHGDDRDRTRRQLESRTRDSDVAVVSLRS
jgi:hypothetical protein